MSGRTSDGRRSKAVAGQRRLEVTDTASMRDAVVAAAYAILTPEQMAEVTADRMLIEQVKGMLMVIYDVDADRAFYLLRRRSQTEGVSVRVLAGQLVSELRAVSNGARLPSRAKHDEVLVTAHHRVETGQASTPAE